MTSYIYELAELGDDAHGLGCKCCRFSNGIDLPTPATLTIGEIKQHGLRFSTTIFHDWTKLNAILKRFEATIQRRWLKKNTKQRREILLKAWPDMAPAHRPDFIGFRKTLRTAPRSRTCPSAAYLWPYINLEDLQQNRPLLLFLSSRGRSLPDHFISTDIETAHIGRGWDFTECKMGESMFFRDRHSPRAYGKSIGTVQALSAGGVAADKSAISVHPRLGLLGLEIQAGIYDFLLRCAELILHDIEPRLYLLAAHQPVPPPLESKGGEFSTLQDHAFEAPYQVPQKLDIERLKVLIGARRSSAEDHIWMLREDPGYFIDTLKEEREHDRDYSHRCDGSWKRVAACMISDAFTYYIFWDYIHRRLKWMPSLDSQIRRANHQAMRLPSKEESAWAKLDDVISLMMVVPTDRLTHGLPVSPRMRHCYPWHAKMDATLADKWVFKPSRTEAERRVDIVFHAICDPDKRSLHTLNHLTQESQYMLDTEPGASQLVDSWLTGHFADLALLSELRTRIDSLTPWANGWRESGVLESQPVYTSVGRLLKMDGQIGDAVYAACKKTDILGDPNCSTWRYPADKRPSKDNVDQMRFVESRLDSFWSDIEKMVRGMTGRGLMQVLHDNGLSARTLYRTAAWKEPIILQPIATPQRTVPLRQLDANTTRTPTRPDGIISAKKAKVKTKGTPTPAQATPTPEPAATAVPEPVTAPLITVKVPKRAFKALSALLPPPTAENHQRTELAWDELLHALNTIGLQPEKLYGSVWMFKPVPKGERKVELEMNRSIQFHEPKEVRRGSKIPPNMVRTFGRRLRHTFGWEAGMFECE